MPFRREGSPYYHYDRTITVAGESRRIRGSCGTSNRVEARAVEDAAVQAARRELIDGPAKAAVTLDTALGSYIAVVAASQPSFGTTTSQGKALIAGLGKAPALHLITHKTLIDYQIRRRAHVANATVNRELQLLRRVINHAGLALDARTPEIDWRKLALREPKERARELTPAEEARLFKALRPDFHALVRFCLATGCRVGSAIRLDWRDVDPDSRAIVLRMMKGGEHHTIPLSRGLAAILEPLRAQRAAYLRKAPAKVRLSIGERVFLYRFRETAQLRPFTLAGWKKPWWAALETAGIPDFRFHDNRHTALSRMTRVKGLKAAQRLAGHASITSTARYAHCEHDELREAMERVEATHTGPTIVETGENQDKAKPLAKRRKAPK